MFTDNLPTDPKIVIIGGGVAGLAAATRLLERGFSKVKVLEAENRLGGRVKTVAFGDRYVDLGAHWIHGEEGNSVFNIASSMELTCNSRDFENVMFVTEDGEEVSSCPELYLNMGEILEDEDTLKNTKGNLYDFVVSRCTKISKEKLLDHRVLQAFVEWFIKFECTIEGCDDLKDVSAPGLAEYKRCPGDSVMTWKDGGYNSIVEILLNMHPLSEGPAVDLEEIVFLNCEVIEIDWSGLEALIKCANGSIHRADHVIVTASVGVLKERHSTLFKPPLPDSKLDAIRGLGIGTVDKIYLHFPYQWWPQNCSGFSLLRKNTILSRSEVYPWENGVIGFYAESSAPKVLGAWLIGDAARDAELYTDEQILEGCYRLLRNYLGHKFVIPEPTDVLRSKWFSNPHFRGSYSFRSLTTEALKTGAKSLAKPIANFYNRELLMFAGEATHPNYYSTVHGALESGWREADNIAKKYVLSRKCSL